MNRTPLSAVILSAVVLLLLPSCASRKVTSEVLTLADSVRALRQSDTAFVSLDVQSVTDSLSRYSRRDSTEVIEHIVETYTPVQSSDGSVSTSTLTSRDITRHVTSTLSIDSTLSVQRALNARLDSLSSRYDMLVERNQRLSDSLYVQRTTGTASLTTGQKIISGLTSCSLLVLFIAMVFTAIWWKK